MSQESKMTFKFRNTKPATNSWRTAKPFSADLYNLRWPLAGTHMIWAVVGHKWVRVYKPVTNVRFKIKRADWDLTAKREVA
jgi:hypothetical protein